MKADAMETPVSIGKEPVVEAVIYEKNSLLIGFDPDADGARLTIRFEEPRAFRCLDEGDLANYWQHEELAENWLFEVFEGGWLDDESDDHMEASKTIGFREFLIRGIDDCVSVLAEDGPVISLHMAGDWNA